MERKAYTRLSHCFAKRGRGRVSFGSGARNNFSSTQVKCSKKHYSSIIRSFIVVIDRVYAKGYNLLALGKEDPHEQGCDF
jgi:hypothetical protein